MQTLVGKKLKDYCVLRPLGRGAMAEVYLAQQVSLGRPVALKVLNADLARDPTYVERFHHEARAAAALVHAGIVQIYEVGESAGGHFIAQEYVPGRNLGEVIRSHGRLDAGMTVDILRQVAAALAKAASEGIVHRDIKPENIMLARNGEVKVADFGLARVQGDGGMNLTQIGVTMGTPLYMSPEQIEGRPLDSRSDVYSLGITAYHMLCGQPPYSGETPLAVAVQHLNQEPEPLLSRRPDVNAEVAEVVHRMLAKRPEDRFADPAALARELHAIVKRMEQGGMGTTGPWALAEIIAAADNRAELTSRLAEVMKTSAIMVQATPKSRRHWLLVAAACLLIGALLGVLARPIPLLAGARDGPPRLNSVWGQLYHAKKVDTEEAWRAVDVHFRDADSYVKNLAKQGLAQYYLFRTEEYDKAIEPLRELANLGSSHPALEAFGIAGLVVAEAKLGRYDDARRENARLTGPMMALVHDRAPQLNEQLELTLPDLDGGGPPRRFGE